MNPLAIIATISSVVSVAQAAIKLGHDVKPFVDIIWNDIFDHGEPKTEAEAAVIAQTVTDKLDELRVRLHMPLAAEQPDDV